MRQNWLDGDQFNPSAAVRFGLVSTNLARFFIVPQPGKARMSQMTVRRPFGKLDLRNKLRPEPDAIFHLVACERLLRAFTLGQVGKWAGVRL
jgi:hypothetical protein